MTRKPIPKPAIIATKRIYKLKYVKVLCQGCGGYSWTQWHGNGLERYLCNDCCAATTGLPVLGRNGVPKYPQDIKNLFG